MSSNNQNIIPKLCNYNCGTRIYWNTSENAYFEVFSGNRHQCPNRSRSNTTTTIKPKNDFTKPNYYNKFSNKQQQPKPKMSNSLELLQGPIADVQKKYEILSDIVSSEANGKVHGSQSHIIDSKTIQLIVYFEVPEGQRDEIKQKFNSFVKNLMVNYSHQQKYNDEKHL
jgi:hypothetical protein